MRNCKRMNGRMQGCMDAWMYELMITMLFVLKLGAYSTLSIRV